MFTQGSVEVLAIVGVIVTEPPVGGGIVALPGQQLGPERLA
ncbi:hypothetical protein [Aeromonas molluscorum]|nr:hypothetical protein [Aeromonas molluscorum]